MSSTSSRQRSFWPAFQKRWAAVLCEQTEGLNLWSENMTQALARGILEVPNSAEAHSALAQLNVRLSRLESARLSDEKTFFDPTARSLLVNYGAALLSSPFEVNQRLNASVGVLQYGDLKRLLDQLCEWLQALKVMPRRVFSLGDFDSQIIGRAVALQLGVEFFVADGDGFTHSKSLIVSVNNRALLDAPLRTVFPAQVLYSFNLHRDGGVLVPDVASVSCGDLVLPWHEERLSARKLSAIVERIGGAPAPAWASHWTERLEFYRAHRQLLVAGNSCYSRSFMFPEPT